MVLRKPSHGSMPSGSQPLASRLKHLDIYARPKAEFRRATVHGAVVSWVAAVAVVVLFWRELLYSLRTETVDQLFVNSTIDPQLNISFSVVFPHIACASVSVDVEDTMGSATSAEGVESHIIKTRLDLSGRPLDEGVKHKLGDTIKSEEMLLGVDGQKELQQALSEDKAPESAEPCGNCYGAGEPGECCNSCEEVRDAYRRKGWSFSSARVAACAKDAGLPALDVPGGGQDQGCRLAGYVEVSKSEGNLHFAPGHRLHRSVQSLSLVDMIQVTFEAFNTTHHIESLSFGDSIPGTKSPLAGHSRSIDDTHAMHQYFLKVVPTVYRPLDGSEVNSNQYSVTEHLKHLSPGTNRGLPGVYFYYEVSHIQARVEERRRGWLQFLTSACGVVGGVYAVLGLVNSAIDGFKPKTV